VSAFALLAGVCAGCGPDRAKEPVPYPVSLLLPKSVHFHSFTKTRIFDEKGGIRGIEAWVTLRDAYGDPTKAFGELRFELYEFRPGNPNRRGGRKAHWAVSIMDPRANRVHWNDASLAYTCRLRWDESIPVGQHFVLAVTFSSPFTERLFAERELVAGE